MANASAGKGAGAVSALIGKALDLQTQVLLLLLLWFARQMPKHS
jgi:hypothetical protein